MAKILIADDERRLLELLERVLGKRGHEVETFPDGASAIEAIEAGGEYDLVLTDLRMPQKSGLEVLEASKARRPKTPVLLISGATEPEDRARAEALGVYMVLHKPVDLAYLMTIVDAALDREVTGAKSAGPKAPESAPPPKASPAPPASAGVPPASIPAPAAPAPPPAPSPEPPAPLGVRVIDREACLENMIAYCLKKQGYRVLSGGSSNAPQVAIVGLLGAIEAVRRDAPKAVLIALYPEETPEDAVRALDAGADAALSRPFDPEVLFAHVRAAARRLGALTEKDGAGPAASREARAAAEERPISRNRLAAVKN